ncbi:hypothetical protein H5410_050216 [Solanum commersonii]|uniref:Uncharacterized protein n=1 Tax=Solanum commersonii TaxID=4109 RepID=A0A9J5WWE5_SOLCO|nr:hypothetical protein H5410_050216 [Solanum commersonii]
MLCLSSPTAKVEDRLDKLRRDFLWLGNKEGKGIHLVKWQTVQLSKKSGGLGIKNLGRKIGVSCQNGYGGLYGQTDSWTSNTVTKTYGVSFGGPSKFVAKTSEEHMLQASIAEMWSQQGWNITFRRLLNDWEVDRVANLLQRLEDFSGLNTNRCNRWKHDRDGEFSVGRMYKETRQHIREISRPWKQI